MAELITTSQLSSPDEVYNMVIDAHRQLTAEQSQELNARLVLLLANHIGDLEVLEQAIALTRREI